jgi:hypothetical protein
MLLLLSAISFAFCALLFCRWVGISKRGELVFREYLDIQHIIFEYLNNAEVALLLLLLLSSLSLLAVHGNDGWWCCASLSHFPSSSCRSDSGLDWQRLLRLSFSLFFVLLLLLFIPSDGRIMLMGPLCDSVWIICIDCLCVCLSLFAHRLSSLFILYEPSRVHYWRLTACRDVVYV